MTGVERIEAKCLEHGVKHQRETDTITVYPVNEDGFPVFFMQTAGAYLVAALGWEEEIDDLEEALAKVALLLSGRSRVIQVSRGSVPHHWHLEILDGEGKWQKRGSMGLMLFPFWRRRWKEIFLNAPQIPGDGELASLFAGKK